MDFLKQVNLTIINTMPQSRGLFTRFMDNSGRPGTRSLLDYGLIDHDHTNTVTSFVIDEDARYEAGSDHALLECNITDSTDYSRYQTLLGSCVSSIPLHSFADLPCTDMLPHLSASVNASAMSALGLKVRKKRAGRRLPMDVIRMIRANNMK